MMKIGLVIFMPELIRTSYVKAKKLHFCNYCNSPIRKGELHNYSFLKVGETYSWRAHLECKFLAEQLWEYIDPWDGMHEDEFQEGVGDFCSDFVCPLCSAYDKDDGECSDFEDCCIWKVGETLKTYELINSGRNSLGTKRFKLVPRKVPITSYAEYYGVDKR